LDWGVFWLVTDLEKQTLYHGFGQRVLAVGLTKSPFCLMNMEKPWEIER
jgi:hypothetical protein